MSCAQPATCMRQSSGLAPAIISTQPHQKPAATARQGAEPLPPPLTVFVTDATQAHRQPAIRQTRAPKPHVVLAQAVNIDAQPRETLAPKNDACSPLLNK